MVLGMATGSIMISGRDDQYFEQDKSVCGDKKLWIWRFFFFLMRFNMQGAYEIWRYEKKLRAIALTFDHFILATRASRFRGGLFNLSLTFCRTVEHC
jgi:hypothetical protein